MHSFCRKYLHVAAPSHWIFHFVDVIYFLPSPIYRNLKLEETLVLYLRQNSAQMIVFTNYKNVYPCITSSPSWSDWLFTVVSANGMDPASMTTWWQPNGSPLRDTVHNYVSVINTVLQNHASTEIKLLGMRCRHPLEQRI